MPTRLWIAIAASVALTACAPPPAAMPPAATQPVVAQAEPTPAVNSPVAAGRALSLHAAIFDAPLVGGAGRAYPLGAPDQSVSLLLDGNGDGRLEVPDAWAPGTPIVVVASGEAGTAAALVLTPAASGVLQAGANYVSLSVAHGLAYALLRPRLEAIGQIARGAAGTYDPAPVKASLATLQAFSAAMVSALAAAPAAIRQAAAKALDPAGQNTPDAGLVNALRMAFPALDAAFDTAASALSGQIRSAVALGAVPPDARLTGPLNFGARTAGPVANSSSGGGGSGGGSGSDIPTDTPAPTMILEGQAE